MILYSAPLSLFARKVEIAMAEKALKFERVMVPFSQTRGYAPKHPAVLAANPKGQVPVLVDGDLTLYDSTVITEYLEDAYPLPPLLPDDPVVRAQCRLLELEADEILLSPVRKLMHRSELPSPDAAARQQQEVEATEAEKLIAQNYGMLELKLASREFLCSAFTVADIATFMVVHYGLRPGAPSLSGHRNLLSWHQRLSRRPSFTNAIWEIDEADKLLSHPVTRR